MRAPRRYHFRSAAVPLVGQDEIVSHLRADDERPRIFGNDLFVPNTDAGSQLLMAGIVACRFTCALLLVRLGA
jgi:hypothetical protein